MESNPFAVAPMRDKSDPNVSRDVYWERWTDWLGHRQIDETVLVENEQPLPSPHETPRTLLQDMIQEGYAVSDGLIDEAAATDPWAIDVEELRQFRDEAEIARDAAQDYARFGPEWGEVSTLAADERSDDGYEIDR